MRACSFTSTIGQFVLTASLRSQVNPENKNEFKDVSPERFVFHTRTHVPLYIIQWLTVLVAGHLRTLRWARSCCISSCSISLDDCTRSI